MPDLTVVQPYTDRCLSCNGRGEIEIVKDWEDVDWEDDEDWEDVDWEDE